MPPLSDEPCKSEETELRSSGLPAEFRNAAPKPCLPAIPKGKPPCSKCRARSQQLKGMKYIQPEIPPSFKPEGRYKPPCFPLESGTVYKLSYPGVDGSTMKECKPKSTFVRDNIRPSDFPFSQDTTFRLSYTGAQGERPIPFKPVFRNMLGAGPMQSITTHRHDFVPKVSERPNQLRVNDNIYLSNAKMENATTMMLSYQPVEGEKAVSFKPSQVYRKSDFKLEQDTINRLSYQPWEPMPKEEYPWKKREQYKQPTFSMEGNTIYRARKSLDLPVNPHLKFKNIAPRHYITIHYLPVENYEKPPLCKPPISICMVDKPLSSATIYRESYQDNGVVPRPQPVVTRGNIYLSTQPMSQETTARLSYTGIGGEKATPFKPLYRNMMGSGPMQCVTTQRHDYVPKPIVPVENYKPHPTLLSSNFKMEDTTTFRASYLPNEVLPKTESFKPVSVYKKSEYPLESDTINRLSYQPFIPMPKEEHPWMKKPRYEQPSRCMDGTSIYRGSYLAPGHFMSDGSGGADEECECQKLQTATDDL